MLYDVFKKQSSSMYHLVELTKQICVSVHTSNQTINLHQLIQDHHVLINPSRIILSGTT